MPFRRSLDPTSEADDVLQTIGFGTDAAKFLETVIETSGLAGPIFYRWVIEKSQSESDRGRSLGLVVQIRQPVVRLQFMASSVCLLGFLIWTSRDE